jgi:hypothetical protein
LGRGKRKYEKNKEKIGGLISNCDFFSLPALPGKILICVYIEK